MAWQALTLGAAAAQAALLLYSVLSLVCLGILASVGHELEEKH